MSLLFCPVVCIFPIVHLKNRPVDSFNEISAELFFEKFSYSFDVHSFYFFFGMFVCLKYSQVLLIVYIFKCSSAFHIYFFRFFSFPTFHYQHGTFFIA